MKRNSHIKIFNSFRKKHANDNITTEAPSNIDLDIDKNIAQITNELGNSSDLEVMHFQTSKSLICALYIKNLVDKTKINALSSELIKFIEQNKKNDMNFDILKSDLSGLRESNEGCDFETLYADLLSGNTVFLVDKYGKFFSIAASSDDGRSIEEPTSQTVIRGPKDGFTEKISNNILLIRKRIKSKFLRVENLYLGATTRTSVTLMYIQNIAKEEIVQEVRNRLDKVKIDGILESGYIEELIKDDRYSVFPTFLNSEKPDSVVAALLEGKIAILVDGTPYVLTVPALMVEFLQSSEDYYHHFFVSSMMRFIRYVAFFLTLLVPSVFVALTTFHQEMLPTPLLVSIAAQREGIPFPALIEALIMEFTFEILREAGIRMPRAIGPAISIVGALVLGQAGVEAGIISAAMVIVVSLTAIASFAIPNFDMANAVRIVRFVLMLLAGVLGLYGIFMGLIILTLHLCKMKSVTVPYLGPFGPKIKGGNKDTFFRFPLWTMKYRPAGIGGSNSVRVDDSDNKDPVSPKQKEKPELR